MTDDLDGFADSGYPIVVELSPGREEIDVALTAEEIVARSEAAIENALDQVHRVNRLVSNSLQRMPSIERPTSLEIEFGIKLYSDSNAVIVKAGLETHIDVKLIWEDASR